MNQEEMNNPSQDPYKTDAWQRTAEDNFECIQKEKFESFADYLLKLKKKVNEEPWSLKQALDFVRNDSAAGSIADWLNTYIKHDNYLVAGLGGSLKRKQRQVPPPSVLRDLLAYLACDSNESDLNKIKNEITSFFDSGAEFHTDSLPVFNAFLYTCWATEYFHRAVKKADASSE